MRPARRALRPHGEDSGAGAALLRKRPAGRAWAAGSPAPPTGFAHFDFAGAFGRQPAGQPSPPRFFAVAAVWTLLHLAFKVPVPGSTSRTASGASCASGWWRRWRSTTRSWWSRPGSQGCSSDAPRSPGRRRLPRGLGAVRRGPQPVARAQGPARGGQRQHRRHQRRAGGGQEAGRPGALPRRRQGRRAGLSSRKALPRGVTGCTRRWGWPPSWATSSRCGCKFKGGKGVATAMGVLRGALALVGALRASPPTPPSSPSRG